MKKSPITLFILTLLVVSTSTLFAQTDSHESCLGGFCIQRDGDQYSLTNGAGETLIPASPDKLTFATNPSKQKALFFIERGGRWGVIDTLGREIIPAKYQHARQIQVLGHNPYIQVQEGPSQLNNIGLYNMDGVQILPPDYSKIEILPQRPDLIFACIDSLQNPVDYADVEGTLRFKLFDPNGRSLSNKTFHALKRARFFQDKNAWQGKLENGHEVIIGYGGFGALISQEFLSIEQVKSYVVFTELPNEDGIPYKRLLIRRSVPEALQNFGKNMHLSDAIYIDVCFDPECTLKYASPEQEKRLRAHLSAAVGVLKNGQFHSFTGSGDRSLVE
jgi:hypothetical protein